MDHVPAGEHPARRHEEPRAPEPPRLVGDAHHALAEQRDQRVRLPLRRRGHRLRGSLPHSSVTFSDASALPSTIRPVSFPFFTASWIPSSTVVFDGVTFSSPDRTASRDALQRPRHVREIEGVLPAHLLRDLPALIQSAACTSATD